MKLLITNQSKSERIVRAAIALIFLGMPIAMDSGLLLIVYLFCGFGLMFNAVTGNCYFYRFLGYSSCPV